MPAITLSQAKARYWALQRQSDLALAVLKDLVRVQAAAGRSAADLAADLAISERVVTQALRESDRGDDAFTYSLPDGSYVRRWYSAELAAMTWFAGQARDLGFAPEIGPFATMEEAIAALP